jgi:hypothetical protein
MAVEVLMVIPRQPKEQLQVRFVSVPINLLPKPTSNLDNDL